MGVVPWFGKELQDSINPHYNAGMACCCAVHSALYSWPNLFTKSVKLCSLKFDAFEQELPPDELCSVW